MSSEGLTMNQLAEKNAEYVTQVANLTEQVRALTEQRDAVVVECVVKSRCLGFFASVIKSGEEWTSVCQHEYSEAMKTPATDAAIASLRAEGVEMLARSFREKAEHATKNLWTGEAIAFEAQASMAEDFARQLRDSKGANHE